jgi:membrane protein implicated in regulation of membrane protease activity
MDDWVLWLIAAVIFGIGEIATTGFFLAPFAGGAALAAIVSALGAGAAASWLVFLVVSIALLLALRPVARRMQRRMPAHLRTGTAALVGKQAMVLERIANDEGVGCVRIDGEVWTARAYDEDEVIEAGQRVHVVEIRGATALVSELGG